MIYKELIKQPKYKFVIVWDVIKIKTLDNKLNKVGDELKVNIEKGSKISIISSYFSIYAFKELKKELSKINELRFIF